MLMRAPAGMTSLHSGHEKVDEASGRTVSTQRAHSSWLPSQGMILGSRSSSSKGSRHTGHSRALMTVRSLVLPSTLSFPGAYSRIVCMQIFSHSRIFHRLLRATTFTLE